MSSKGRLRRDSISNEERQILNLSNEQPSTSRQHFPSKTTGGEHSPEAVYNAVSEGSWMPLRIILIALLVICIVAVFYCINLDTLKGLESVFKENDTGMVLFVVCAVVAFACLIPGPFIAGAAGLLYGRVTGVFVVWLSALAGQSLTFLLGKYLFREILVSFISRYYKSFSAVDHVIGQQGWKLVFLLRLAPIFPDSILNYVLATTSIPFVPYITASGTAIVPWIIIFTYMGSLATDIASATSLETNLDSKWLTYLTLFSILLCIVFAYFIAKTAKKALEGMMDDKDGDKSISIEL